jgi:recombination endonuclease VII
MGTSKKTRNKLIASGKCVQQCGRDKVTKTLCEECRIKKNENYRRNIEIGMCHMGCGNPIVKAKKCRSCYDRVLLCIKEKRLGRIKQNLCVGCGSVPPEKGRRCVTCYNRQRDAFHGMPEGSYQSLIEKHPVCASCSREFSVDGSGGSKAVLDHCHITGKVRGILCHGCNASLGLLRDDPEVIRKLAAYIETTGEQSTLFTTKSMGKDHIYQKAA